MNQEFFKNPLTDPDYSVSGFWFWNDTITDEKTTQQMNLMKTIGANQPVVHSRFGLTNEYLSNDWFERIQSVIDVCKQNNQKIWLYDENNWPSGNCSWTITMEEELREHYLQFDVVKLKEKEELTINKKEKNYLTITAYLEDDTQIELLKEEEDIFVFSSNQKAEVYAVYVDVDAYEPIGKLCVDYLSKEAIQKFLESTHEKYKEYFSDEFGKIITGIFMDETRFCNAMPWTKTFANEFEKRKGYDITDYLALLVKKTNQSDYVRYDYYDVVSDLYTEATFKQVYDWCDKNNLLTIGHFLGEETLATQSYFGGDMMRGYQYFHVPGIDHLGNGIGSLDAKFAVSASHHYGKTRIACEAFGASGWDMNFEDMVKISNWLFQQGINLIIMHGFYYSIREERNNDFPPSYFYQWKYWDHMPMYVKMANRMMEMLSNGRQECEILVYAPMETFWNYFEPDLEVKTGFWKEGPWITDENAKMIDNQFQLLCNKLVDRNLDYHIFGADAAKNFKVEGNRLVNVITKASYEIFVLPLTKVLTQDMVLLLNEFSEAGGKIISYQSDVTTVVRKDGAHMRNHEGEKLKQHKHIVLDRIAKLVRFCEDNINPHYDILCGVDEVAHTKSSYEARLIDPYIHDGESLYGVGVNRYVKGEERIFNFTNYNDKDEDLQVFVESKSVPMLCNPENGDIIILKAAKSVQKGYEFKLTIPKNRSLFVVTNK